MKNKLVLLTGVAVGYVLGTRAGRDQYEKIRSQAKEMWQDPKVQEQVSQVQEQVKNQASQATKTVKEKVGSNGDSDSGSPDSQGPGGQPQTGAGI